MASTPPWSELLPELLGHVIARLPVPGDRARFRAVCRPWHSAMRQHARSAPPQLPWIIHSDGTFVTLPDRDRHRARRLPFPADACGWLAFCRAAGARRSYLLHNPFSGETVPLPGLDSVIGGASGRFEVRKVLMRSDLVVVTTNNLKHPIILCRAGQPGAWAPPRPGMPPYADIFDAAFVGGRLYGITVDGAVVRLGLGAEDDGAAITSATYVVGCPRYDDEFSDDGVSSADEDESDGEAEHDEATRIDGYDPVYDDMVPDGVEDGADPCNPMEYIKTTRHLLESNGKLLMVRRQRYLLPYARGYTGEVEIMEADLDAGAWVPAAADGIDMLFIGDRFAGSVSVPCGREDKKVPYLL